MELLRDKQCKQNRGDHSRSVVTLHAHQLNRGRVCNCVSPSLYVCVSVCKCVSPSTRPMGML